MSTGATIRDMKARVAHTICKTVYAGLCSTGPQNKTIPGVGCACERAGRLKVCDNMRDAAEAAIQEILHT